MRKKLQSNTMTREQLKETIQVNFELFKDDPDFYEYITTLVIYLMKYEYAESPEGVPVVDRMHEDQRIPTIKDYITHHMVLSGRGSDKCHCKYCNGEIRPDARICPYCLSMTD